MADTKRFKVGNPPTETTDVNIALTREEVGQLVTASVQAAMTCFNDNLSALVTSKLEDFEHELVDSGHIHETGLVNLTGKTSRDSNELKKTSGDVESEQTHSTDVCAIRNEEYSRRTHDDSVRAIALNKEEACTSTVIQLLNNVLHIHDIEGKHVQVQKSSMDASHPLPSSHAGHAPPPAVTAWSHQRELRDQVIAVTPIHKEKERFQMSNYRPISPLPAISINF